MKRTYLTLIVLMLVIGFAAVSANLVLSGTLKLGFNSEEFEEGVIFTKADSINGLASIQENDKTINYTTNKLDEIGEESVLDYNITNKSNQYDADVTISCTLNNDSSTYSDYIELSEDINKSFELSAGETKDGRVKVKLKKSYVASDNTQIEFTCTIVATAKEKEETVEYKPETIYTEAALNGADPVLEGNGISTVSLEEKEEKKLIPVNISDNGTVTYADITEKWYDYENQQWANAVILSNYNHIPKVGEVIPEEDIESYFVWIPKYRYKIFDLGEYDNTNGAISDVNKPIEIEFNINNTSDDNSNECTTPNKSGEKDSCAVDKWMTHPAFTSFGDIKGFWAGKFEVGYKDAKTSKEAEVDIQDSTKVTVKPNVYSWRSITIKNMFNSLKEYATNLDSHMMKNTEWGAVAYLSHSKYGINDEVVQNANSDYLTGYAQVSENDLVSYSSQSGFIASTTGNITGIYDMSGGVWERMAAYRDVEDNNQIGESGFTKQDVTSLGEKYFDVYDKNSVNTSYDKRILGDATGEMGPFSKYRGSWHQDYAYFVEADSPWFVRGGVYSDATGGSGQFGSGKSKGGVGLTGGSRLVLSPQ